MNGTVITFIVIVGLFLIAWQASNLVALYFGAPFNRNSIKSIREILDLANIQTGEKFFELGSAWGVVLAYVSKKYQTQAYGIEVSPIHYLVSSLINYTNKRVKIRLADFSDFGLNRADVVYCKLSKRMTAKMENKFQAELKPGTRVITCRYPLPNTEHKFVYQIGKDKVYFYKF